MYLGGFILLQANPRPNYSAEPAPLLRNSVANTKSNRQVSRSEANLLEFKLPVSHINKYNFLQDYLYRNQGILLSYGTLRGPYRRITVDAVT